MLLGQFSPAFASTNDAYSTLENYLIAVKNQDAESMMKYIKEDVRGFSLQDYKEIMEYEKLLDYEIVKKVEVSDSAYIYVLRTSYEGDVMRQDTVKLEKSGFDWKVVIDSETLNSDYNKVVDFGDTEYFEKKFNSLENNQNYSYDLMSSENEVVADTKLDIQTRDVLLMWKFSDRVAGKTFYSNNTLSIPDTTK